VSIKLPNEAYANANVINRWLHSRRYAMVKEYLRQSFGKRKIRLLEIGAAYGRLYAELNEALELDYTGVELLADLYQPTLEMYQANPNFKLLHGSILDRELHQNLAPDYDVVVALETFEHIRIQQVPEVFDLLRNYLRIGILICSVPVEIGVPILVKNLGSYLLHYSRYQEYSLTETWKAAMKQTHRLSPHCGDDSYPAHKGFDWRVIRYLLHQDFSIKREWHLPLLCLPAGLSTNILFIAAPRSRLTRL